MNPLLTSKVNLAEVQGQMFFCGVTCCPFQSRQKRHCCHCCCRHLCHIIHQSAFFTSIFMFSFRSSLFFTLLPHFSSLFAELFISFPFLPLSRVSPRHLSLSFSSDKTFCALMTQFKTLAFKAILV